MANRLYSATATPPPPGMSAPTSTTRLNLSSLYSSARSLADPASTFGSEPYTLSSPDASFKYTSTSSSLYVPRSRAPAYSPTHVANYPSATAASSAIPSSWSRFDDANPLVSSISYKRPSEALYHQNVWGAQTTTGQSEAWYSTNLLSKRPRLESASNLPVYPQRPGEKDCAHYMLTRTCKFGLNCKFDHPIWVPEGGIPDWKEVPLVTTVETLPERPGEPDCPYFLKTQRCKFGSRCKFNHPKDESATLGAAVEADTLALPERPSEPPCAFYMKTGNCKFGTTCKFHHPKDIKATEVVPENGNRVQTHTADGTDRLLVDMKHGPAMLHNSKGLPLRPGEVDCPFYVKTGSCKYGASCRYNHPDRNVLNLSTVGLGPTVAISPTGNPHLAANSAASIYQSADSLLAQVMLGVGPTIYPQRPGQIECDYYMKTGECKYGERCKFHHPIDRSSSTQQTVELTLAGLPRRKDTAMCPYYLKTGTCKFGATCKFDHPPPGEVMAMTVPQGKSPESGEESK